VTVLIRIHRIDHWILADLSSIFFCVYSLCPKKKKKKRTKFREYVLRTTDIRNLERCKDYFWKNQDIKHRMIKDPEFDLKDVIKDEGLIDFHFYKLGFINSSIYSTRENERLNLSRKIFIVQRWIFLSDSRSKVFPFSQNLWLEGHRMILRFITHPILIVFGSSCMQHFFFSHRVIFAKEDQSGRFLKNCWFQHVLICY